MTRLAREGLFGSLAKVNLLVCEPFMGKACRKPFGKAKRATHPLELVHSDICGPMNRFLAEVENQREMNLKLLRTDRGREYLSERRNRTLLEMARSMMAQANLPISFWGDTILTAAYILNRVPSKSVPSTPYELWHGRKPNLKG
ncbi:Copia protein [Sesamum angolense]|uniref:Copia protein n=1 Tax=Sesamum angolense TaxID=2727404 RepID=A0AAE1T8Q1_9LAMI|nr:Copia protein [Sesamum angolense]